MEEGEGSGMPARGAAVPGDAAADGLAAFVPAYAPVLSPRGAARALLALMFVSTMVDAASEAHESAALLVWTFVSGLSSSFLSFYWFRLDREQRGWPRSRWLSTAVVFLTPLAIPWYIAHSRPPGRKLHGVLCFFGYVLLMLLMSAAGGMVALLSA
jgi:hypothetical protein